MRERAPSRKPGAGGSHLLSDLATKLEWMSGRIGNALLALVATLLIGLSSLGIVGCGDESDAETGSIPDWALRLADGAQYGAWSPEGELFAIPAHDRIELIRTDGSLERRIEVFGIDNSGLSCECSLGWSQDGTEIHVVTRPRPQARGGVVVVDADGENLRSRHLDLHIADAAWDPQGWPLALTPGDTVHQAGERPPATYPLLRLDGLDADLDVRLERRREITDLAFSPDGTRIAFTASSERGGGSLWMAPWRGGKPRALLRGLLTSDASWSPDGRQLAVNAVFSKDLRNRQLVLVSAADGQVRPLTKGRIAEGPPAWTPDGRWVTYADEDGDVNKIRRNGTGGRRLFEIPGEEIDGLSWSPDGRHLVFTARPISPID
jgi:dipeptidyl aminopeptidase/acylaminoacyl peptidase